MNQEKIIIELDGNMWCAYRDSFVNLQESNTGFGENPFEALVELLKTEVPSKNCSCHLNPPCSDCVDHGETRDLIEHYTK